MVVNKGTFFNQAEVFCAMIKAAGENRECSYMCEMDLLFELCIKKGLEHLEMRIFAPARAVSFICCNAH